jgi:hypothetical protein
VEEHTHSGFYYTESLFGAAIIHAAKLKEPDIKVYSSKLALNLPEGSRFICPYFSRLRTSLTICP